MLPTKKNRLTLFEKRTQMVKLFQTVILLKFKIKAKNIEYFKLKLKIKKNIENHFCVLQI
jgi:hypothetical protein